MDSSFSSLRGDIAASTMSAIERLGFSTMTEIQARAIPPLLEGEDLRGIAKTGSGKTLAFLIPAVELLLRQKFEPHYGTGVLIVSPTRELCMQTHSVAMQLLQGTPLSCGLITGGRDKEVDRKMLRKGANILVATPGRLLDHLRNTSYFNYSHLACLVLDEADKMLDNNFEEAMLQILKALPEDRQTMLFSATKTANTNKLVSVALKEKFVDLDVSTRQDTVTADGLKQAYVVLPLEHKFLFLYQFLKKRRNKCKLMVFFSTCDAVKFYSTLLTCVQVENICIHGKQKQGERTKAFKEFNAAATGALLCTDVAARGWDIHQVHWVVQYDAPLLPSEYIHRVGRTARGDQEGQALLLLRREELSFVRYLKNHRVDITEVAVTEKGIPKVQEEVENLVENCEYLHWWSKKAYVSCVDAYATHKRPDIFDYWNLDIRELAKSFGLSKVPDVSFAIEYRSSSNKKKHLRRIKEGYYEGTAEEGEADWQSIAAPSH